MSQAFEKYNLDVAEFSQDQFASTFGERLASAGMSDIRDELEHAGENKIFLARPLEGTTRKAIDGVEAPSMARSAATFQQLVRQVRIEESYTPMANLANIASERALEWSFSDTPFHEACGEWAGKPRMYWMREPLAHKLGDMGVLLARADYSIHVQDAFRPQGVQEGLFRRRYQMAKDAYPTWDEDDLMLEAQSKTAYTPRFASHTGGAAVDLVLTDLRSSRSALDTGHAYPDGGALVALDTPYVTQSQWTARQMLRVASRNVGLSMYPFEDWHVCGNDTTAVAASGDVLQPAIYGPIKHFDHQTGEITGVYEQDELDRVFGVSR